MPRNWLPLVVVLLICGGLFFFLQSDGGEPEPQETEEVTAVEEDVEAAPEVEGIGRGTEAVDQAAAVERTELVLPESGPKVSYAEHAEEGILVSVVDGSKQDAPLPHADIMVIDTGVTDMRLVEIAIQTRPNFEQLFLELGVTYRSDAQGQARIPDPTGDLLIAGRTPTHFNFAFDVDDDEEEFTLRLEPLELLAVKVVDEQGRPVKGAPVSLRMANNGFSQDLIQAYTDAEGLAQLRIFQLIKVELGDDETYVALLALTEEPIQELVKLRELPEEPPVLVMPRLGQVTVEVIDDLGEPVKESHIVDLVLLEDDEFQQEDVEEMVYWRDPHPHIVAPTQGGKAVFPLVQPGTKLRAIAISRDQERRAHTDAFGPASIGDKVEIRVAPSVDRPIVVGRILNEEGMVGANLSLQSRLSVRHGGSSSSHNETIQTDGEGRFRMVLEEEFEDGGSRDLTITMRKTKRKPKRSVKVDLGMHYDPGVHDLGDLVVRVPPLLAEGIVLKPDGTPLHKADVILEYARYHGQNDEHVWWNGIWELREETDRDGHFQIRGDVDDQRYRVAARHDDYIQSEEEIALGASGLRIQVKPAVRVKGQFLLDEGLDAELFEAVVYQASTEDPDQEHGRSTNLDDDGDFRMNRLQPGPARLALKTENSQDVLHEITGLHFDASSSKEIDLGTIDLRGQLNVIRVTVVDPLGEPIAKPMVYPLDQGWGRTTDDNPVQIVLPGDAIDLRVSASGYRPQDLREIRNDLTVTLQKAIPVRFQLANGHLLPEGFRVSVHLRFFPDGPDGGSDSSRSGRTGPGRDSVTGTVDGPGHYQVQFRLSREVHNGSRSWSSSNTGPMIEIRESSAEQFFSVEIPDEVLEDAENRSREG